VQYVSYIIDFGAISLKLQLCTTKNTPLEAKKSSAAVWAQSASFFCLSLFYETTGANQIVAFATPDRMFLDRIDTIRRMNKMFLSVYV
jgi:hypothetical protein